MSDTQQAPPVSSVQRLSYRERLDRFYRRYDPSRVHQIDAILVKFERHEEAMFAALVKKYGPEPAPTGPISLKSCRERLKLRIYNFYRFYKPDKLGMVDDLADGYWENGEETLFANLVERYGPEPRVTSSGDVSRAPRRHRGLAVTDDTRRAKVAASSADSSSTIPTERVSDEADIDNFLLADNSDEDLDIEGLTGSGMPSEAAISGTGPSVGGAERESLI